MENSEDKFNARIVQWFLEILSKVTEDRRAYYRRYPHRRKFPRHPDQIIARYSNLNAGISAGIGLIPGPLGIAAAVPEVGLILRNQLAMIYDVGVFYGQDEDSLTPELLASVLASTLGTVGLSALTIHSGNVLHQRVVAIVAAKASQRIVSQAAFKWLPIAGALSMAAWSKYSTMVIGQKAKAILKDKEASP